MLKTTWWLVFAVPLAETLFQDLDDKFRASRRTGEEPVRKDGDGFATGTARSAIESATLET
jgi:hypothetical protein